MLVSGDPGEGAVWLACGRPAMSAQFQTPVHFPGWKDHTCPSLQILKKKRDFSWRGTDHNFQMLGCLFTHLYIHFSFGTYGNTV